MSDTGSGKKLVFTYLALVALTALLVGLSLIGKKYAVMGLLTITPFKAGLIGYNFMHLREESVVVKGGIIFILVNLIVFFTLTFSDLAFR